MVMCLKATALHRQWSQDETLLISFSNEKLNVRQPGSAHRSERRNTLRRPTGEGGEILEGLSAAADHSVSREMAFLPKEGGGGRPGASHQQSLDDGVSVLALVVHHLNVVQVGISPVHQPADQVQRDAVGEHDLTVHELGSVLAVHVASLHLRNLTVICEEDLPVDRKESGGTDRQTGCQRLQSSSM